MTIILHGVDSGWVTLERIVLSDVAGSISLMFRTDFVMLRLHLEVHLLRRWENDLAVVFGTIADLDNPIASPTWLLSGW